MLDIIGVISAHAEHFYKAMQFLKNNQYRLSLADMISNSYSRAQVTTALEAMAALREIKPALSRAWDNCGSESIFRTAEPTHL
ncbi:MAG: hypothetical protein HYX73_08780 [Acidobacteria bacterium]|nr:hypothetical protein [Acidobacteriota bacterium]